MAGWFTDVFDLGGEEDFRGKGQIRDLLVGVGDLVERRIRSFHRHSLGDHDLVHIDSHRCGKTLRHLRVEWIDKGTLRLLVEGVDHHDGGLYGGRVLVSGGSYLYEYLSPQGEDGTGGNCRGATGGVSAHDSMKPIVATPANKRMSLSAPFFITNPLFIPSPSFFIFYESENVIAGEFKESNLIAE